MTNFSLLFTVLYCAGWNWGGPLALCRSTACLLLPTAHMGAGPPGVNSFQGGIHLPAIRKPQRDLTEQLISFVAKCRFYCDLWPIPLYSPTGTAAPRATGSSCCCYSTLLQEIQTGRYHKVLKCSWFEIDWLINLLVYITVFMEAGLWINYLNTLLSTFLYSTEFWWILGHVSASFTVFPFFCLQANMDSLEGKTFSLPAAEFIAKLQTVFLYSSLSP